MYGFIPDTFAKRNTSQYTCIEGNGIDWLKKVREYNNQYGFT